MQRATKALEEIDETAWLETSAELIRSGLWDQIDTEALAEYLSDMARRDKREVVSRLAVLIAHLLKWEYQPEMRSTSRLATAERERQELIELLESGTLRRHAVEALPKAYRYGMRQAAVDTDLSETAFPIDCPWALETLLEKPLQDR